MTDNAIIPILSRLADKANLPRDEAARAFQIVMNGGATPAQVAALLMGLRMKGETAEEIAGGAQALRAKMGAFQAPGICIDTCGTGGDGRGTFNISTAVALVLAACGVPVAKHGNRAVSSKSGSADVLEQLGVKIDAPASVMERCLRELNICFLFAPQYHTAMRHVSPVRQELGMRTVFNLLGPLSNPAQPKLQLLGVYARDWIVPVAQVLHLLGAERAWVVYGADGLDELSLAGTSYIAELKDGAVNTFEIEPEDAGLTRVSSDMLRGSEPPQNAQKLRELLLGAKTPYREAVLLNAAAALIIAGKAKNLAEGVTLATAAIESGDAYKVLQHFTEKSNAV